jgi:hypothetical protein
MMTVGAPAGRPAAPRQASLGVSAIVVRQVSVASFQVADHVTAVYIEGDSYNVRIDNEVVDRPSDGVLTLRLKADRPAVLTIAF